MKKKILAVLMMSLASVAMGTGPQTQMMGKPLAIDVSYQITDDGHAQIVTNISRPDGTVDKRLSPALGKAQINSQIAGITNQIKNMDKQLKVLQDAVADKKLTQ